MDLYYKDTLLAINRKVGFGRKTMMSGEMKVDFQIWVIFVVDYMGYSKYNNDFFSN